MGTSGGLPGGDRSRDLCAELAGVAGGIDHDAVIVEELGDPEPDGGRDADEGDGGARLDVPPQHLSSDDRPVDQARADPAEGK